MVPASPGPASEPTPDFRPPSRWRLPAAVGAVALAAAVAAAVLLRPSAPVAPPLPPNGNGVWSMDPVTKRVVERAIANAHIDLEAYGAVTVFEEPTRTVVWLSPLPCRNVRGGGSACDGYHVIVIHGERHATIEHYEGGK